MVINTILNKINTISLQITFIVFATKKSYFAQKPYAKPYANMNTKIVHEIFL